MSRKKVWGSLDPFLESGEVLGRRVANAGFLDHLLRDDAFDEFHFFLPDQSQIEGFRSRLEEMGPPRPERVKVLHRRDLPLQMAARSYHCFHLADCVTYPGFLAAVRNRFSSRTFPITSLTHSLSYARYTSAFLTHLWAGTTSRDRVVASSRAGRDAVTGFFAVLRERLGLEGRDFPAPDVEIIPLGVDTEYYQPLDAQARRDLRRRENIAPENRVILVFGRLSPRSKMDILPLLRALQRLKLGGLPLDGVRLIVAGWMSQDDDYPETLRRLGANLGLEVRVEASPGEERKLELFAMADLFVSIADNPQETFGLTLLEAGAMGLPVIASDYDGYRDLVEEGVTGVLVPTIGPGETGDTDLMAPLLFDSHTHLDLAQQTLVDVPILANAVATLLSDRRASLEMGRKARVRMQECYAWPLIIARYVRLWDGLWENKVDSLPRASSHPLGISYGRIFGHYPTRHLDDSVRVRWTRSGEAVYRNKDYPLVYAGLEDLVRPDKLSRLLFLARKPVVVGTLKHRLDQDDASGWISDTQRLVLWCLKQDLLELVPEQG